MFDLRLAIFPSDERALHIPIEIIRSNFNQLPIIGIIIPLLPIIFVKMRRSADNEGPVIPRNLINVRPRTRSNAISTRQFLTGCTRCRSNLATNPLAWNDSFRILRGQGACVCVCSEDDLPRVNDTTTSGYWPESIYIWIFPDSRYRCIGLQVQAVRNGNTNEMGNEFVRPEMACWETEASLGVSNMCRLNAMQISSARISEMDLLSRKLISTYVSGLGLR